MGFVHFPPQCLETAASTPMFDNEWRLYPDDSIAQSWQGRGRHGSSWPVWLGRAVETGVGHVPGPLRRRISCKAPHQSASAADAAGVRAASGGDAGESGRREAHERVPPRPRRAFSFSGADDGRDLGAPGRRRQLAHGEGLFEGGGTDGGPRKSSGVRGHPRRDRRGDDRSPRLRATMRSDGNANGKRWGKDRSHRQPRETIWSPRRADAPTGAHARRCRRVSSELLELLLAAGATSFSGNALPAAVRRGMASPSSSASLLSCYWVSLPVSSRTFLVIVWKPPMFGFCPLFTPMFRNSRLHPNVWVLSSFHPDASISQSWQRRGSHVAAMSAQGKTKNHYGR